MEDQEIVQLFWEHSEAAIKETEIKYGARLHQLAMKIITAAGSTTSSAGGLDCPLQGHVAFPPKGGLTNHVHYVTGGRLKAA